MNEFDRREADLKDQVAFYAYSKNQMDGCFIGLDEHTTTSLSDDQKETDCMWETLFSGQSQDIKNVLGNLVFFQEKSSILEASEEILALSKKYLDVTRDDRAQKNIIAFVCFAWNLSFMDPLSGAKDLLNILDDNGNKLDTKTLRKIIDLWAHKKTLKYIFLKRFITGFEWIPSQDGFYLKVYPVDLKIRSTTITESIPSFIWMGYEKIKKGFDAFLTRTLFHANREAEKLLRALVARRKRMELQREAARSNIIKEI